MLEPKNNDAIASPVGDNNDADTVGTDHNNDAETVGTDHNNNGPENLLELLCALTSDNALLGEQRTAARRVHFNDALNTCHDITPYSEICGFLPSTMVATQNGWKKVSARACRFSGK